MNTNVQETSIIAYYDTAAIRKDQADVVYDVYLKHKNCTDKEISNITGIPANLVSARRHDLKHKVVYWGKRKCAITGRMVKAYEPIKQTLF